METTMKLNKKIIEIAESKEFFMNDVEKQDGRYYVEFGQHTPCGEDWWETLWFDGTEESFVEALRERVDDFDVNEEAEIWIENRGKNGIPSSIKALIEDAEWKRSMLEEFVEELEKLKF